MPDLGTTYSPDPEALVELCLRIAGESPDVLDDRVLDDANDPLVFSYLEEDNETGLEQDQGIHIEPSLQDWVAHDVQRLAELEEDKKRLNEALASDPDLQDKVTVVINQRLENLGFREADLRGVPPGVRRVVFLHRAQNGIERPLHLADPLKAETFVIEVACVYTAVYNSFKVRTLHFPTSMRWPQFHERLKQHTTNWQTLGMEDCSEGLTPANGPWRYTLNRQSKGVESIAEWIVVSDEESLRTMKRCLVDSGGDGNQKTAFLIHVSVIGNGARRKLMMM